MPLTFVRTKLGLFIVALVALAVIAAACSSSDDGDAGGPAEPADETQEAAAEQSQSQVEGEPLLEAEGREQAQAQAEVPGQAIDQSQSVPDDEESGAPGSEEQAVEQAEEQAEGEAQTQVQEQAGEEGPADATALLSQLFLGDLASLSDYRFSATLELIVVAEDPENRSFDLINALQGFTFTGVVVPPDTFELTIEFGSSGAGGLPPFGVVQTGGVLYTNFGFGWEAQPPDADVLELASVLIDSDAFGIDFRALLDAIAEQGVLPALIETGAFPLEALRDGLVPEGPAEIDGRPVQRYRLDNFGLSEIIQAIVDPRWLEEQLGLRGVYGGFYDQVITVDVDASGLLVRVAADIEEPSVHFSPDDDPTLLYSNFDAETVHFEMDVHPVLGVPVRILIEMPEFEVDSDAPYAGSLRLEIMLDDLNAGNVTVEPPI